MHSDLDAPFFKMFTTLTPISRYARSAPTPEKHLFSAFLFKLTRGTASNGSDPAPPPPPPEASTLGGAGGQSPPWK